LTPNGGRIEVLGPSHVPARLKNRRRRARTHFAIPVETRMNLVPMSRQRLLRPLWPATLAFALAYATPAIAQPAPDTAALAQQLERSLRLIDALTARVE